jgi:amino-acid N-acetyltransferase
VKTTTPPAKAMVRTRRARLADATAIHALVASYAAEGLLLSRTEDEIRRRIGSFLVLEEKGRLAGCAALEAYGADLAEIRSLAVVSSARGRGLGAHLVEFAFAEACRRRIARVFAVTHAPGFFLQQGFALTVRQSLPEKMARDCCGCPKSRSCRLAAVIATVIPERAFFRIHDVPAVPVPVA